MAKTMTKIKLKTKPVPGYPQYLAREDGAIFSVRTRKWLKHTPDRHGYPRVTFCLNSKKWGFLVHKLVLLTFVGPRPMGLEARHLNSNPADCSRGNLEWNTPVINQRDRIKNGTHQFGEQNPAAKLSWEQVRLIRRLNPATEKERIKVGQRYGVGEENVRKILEGRSWRE